MSFQELEASQYACDVPKLDALLEKDGCKRLSVAITDFEGECGVMVLQQIHKLELNLI